MKKILFLASLFVVLVAMTAKADNLRIDRIDIEAGQEATVDVELDNPTLQYTGIQFELILPEGIILKWLEDDEEYEYEINSGRLSGRNWSVTITKIKDDTYQFIIYNLKNTAVKGTSGALLSLTFVASGTLAKGTLTGHLKNQMLAIDKDNSTDVEDTPFYINGDGSDIKKTDVNDDGKVNALDIQEVINAAVVESTEAKYDVNSDGKVNALDIQEVINAAAAEAARQFEL